MKPGRELDALVANKVMGFQTDPRFKVGDECPHFSTSIEAAWAVVEKLLPRLISLRWCDGWEVNEFLPEEKETYLLGESDTAPHAICLAALAAVGYTKGQENHSPTP